MVFEAVVVELLNKFLKQYVENLDTSQLKIGIWGGDVILKDLRIKTTLFEDLGIPVRVKWGKLGHLAMKIPWKNLYGSQVVFNIDELLMIVIPNTEIKFDPIKEEKWQQDKKQAKLKAIEEAKKRELETDPTKQPTDSFMEKLFTQITKNLQIEIKNIHIRYEDKTTIPGSPFSFGLTMSNLSAHTTINNTSINYSKFMVDNENFICKAVDLEGLAIYWNSLSVLFSDLPTTELEKALMMSIPTSISRPKGFKYMFGPLSSSAFLRLNSKPELDGSDYTIPKIFINVHLREIELGIGHNQFSDLLMFYENYERLALSAKFKKYRPTGVPVIGNAAKWWHFSYNTIAENIKRRKKEWSWENIRNHRNLCRKYSELFKQKLQLKKLNSVAAVELAQLERNLNVFNLILLREQVYVEVERSNLKKTEVKPSGGWFSGWFGSPTTSKLELNEEDELVKRLESVMTVQEKEKLYKAIGYEESAPPTSYPPSFVELQFWCHLEEIKLTVYDDRLGKSSPAMTSSIKTVKIELEQRPVDFAMKLVMMVGNFQVLGRSDKSTTLPELVTSSCSESQSLFEILYENKPLAATCDQRIIITARPLRIIYHAATLNLLCEMFGTGADEDVHKIVAATSSSLPTFQKITAAGLQYAIEKRTVLEVKVNIMSSYLIIPYGGYYQAQKEMLVITLGHLSIETEENEKREISIKQLHLKGTAEQDIFSTVVSSSYTKFKLHLTGVQILFQLSGEDWVTTTKTRGPSPLRFLESINLEVIVKKSLVTDDARIPKVIIEGKLPTLVFNFSEERFIAFAALFFSMPPKAQSLKKEKSTSVWSLQSISSQIENKLSHFQKDSSFQRTTEYVQGIDLVGHFEMNEVTIKVSKSKNLSDLEKNKELKLPHEEEQFLTLRLLKMEVEMTNKTFETVNLLKLGGIEINQFHMGNMMSFVSTKKLEQDFYLFVVEHISLDRKVPDFYTTRGGILNRLTVNVTPLSMVLNQEALLAQIAFATNLQMRLESVKQAARLERQGDSGKLKENYHDDLYHGDKKVLSKGKRFRKKRLKKEVIDFFLDASLDEIDIVVGYQGRGLVEFSIKGGSVEISTRKSYTNLDFKLREVTLLDLNPSTFFKEIVMSLEDQTLSSRVTVFNSEYFGTERSADMAIEAEFGQLRLAFVRVFFSRALEFLNAFQLQFKSFKEGATVAAQRAKENVWKAYQNATQVCLDIKMMAPLLIVPKTSTCFESLVLDMGVLTIKNAITELDYSPGGELIGRPIIDTMKLHLQNLKVTRCILAKDTMKQEEENVLLVPVSFELTIKRNLSKGWFRVIPELEILARLASIHVILTHEDLCFVASAVRSNLNEGSTHTVGTTAPSQQGLSKISKHKKDTHQDHQIHFPEEDEASRAKEASTFYTTIKFMFFMDSFVFDALVKKVDDNTDKIELATFVLETISLKGKTFSDNSIHTSIMLVSCILEDMRPAKKDKIKRFMERTIDAGSSDAEAEVNPLNAMIELTFQQKDLDTFMDMRVYKFTLILSMDFLQKVGQFFTLEDCSATDVPISTIDSAEGMKSTKAVEKHKKIIKMEHSGEEEEKERLPTLTINLRLEKPDIIIVQNMDSIDTEALIFHTEMVVKYRFAGARQVISGTFSDIELYSCCYNPVKRPKTLSQVIKPFTISVAGSTPQGQGLHIDVCLTEIAITINPNTVELITKCYEALISDTLVDSQGCDKKVLTDLWDVETFDPNSYWFLKPEPAVDALEVVECASPSSETEKFTKAEICLLAIPSIVVSVEDISTNQMKPLLLLEMGFELNVYNWSHQMSIESTLSIELHYFNKTLSAWEPLIEPVEEISDRQKHAYMPWELKCHVVFSDEGDLDWTTVQPPKVSVSLSCSEILQVTVTKTSLEVMKNMANTFTSAVTKGVVKKPQDLPPYIVKNETGFAVELLLRDCDLQVYKAISEYYKIVKLESNSEVELQDKTVFVAGSLIGRTVSVTKKHTRLCIRFPFSKKDMIEFQLNINSKRYYSVSVGDAERGQTWGCVADISIKDNTTTVVLRSIIKIVNDLYEPVNVHLLTNDEKAVEYIGTVEGKSTFNLPFGAVYREHKNLFFSINGYSLSLQSYSWDRIKKDSNFSTILQCNSKTPERNDPFFILVVGVAEQIYFNNTNRRTSTSMCYSIYLQPTVKMLNSLPTELVICFQGCDKERILKPGDNLHITNAEPGVSTITLRISDYLEKEWSCKETILENFPEFFIWKFVSYNGLTPEILNLGVHCTYNNKTAIYVLYCPYFMVNKTEHLLSYKFDGNPTVFYHPGDMKLPVMFSTNAKKFFSKKSAFLQVEQSDWSEKFPVDVAGCGGTVKCEDADITYKISVRITLTHNNLTRIVVFTPYYVLVNECDYSIEYQECDLAEHPWVEISSGSCKPFWPRSKAKVKTVHIRPKGSNVNTPPFAYDSTDSCLLRLSHECGGIFVNVQATQSGNYITFSPYEPGQAPVLILNHSAKAIKLIESNTDNVISLMPLQKVLYSWACPTGDRKLVLMNYKQKKDVIIIDEDAEGRVLTSKTDGVRYVTFLEGAQRMLLFSDVQGITTSISSSLKLAFSGVEIVCKIQGIGVSVVNNSTQLEILYMGFVSSGIAWEGRKQGKTKFKSLNSEDTFKLESAFEKYKNDMEIRQVVDPVVEVTDRLKVNFEKMEMIHPQKKDLKRTFEPGLWVAYRYLEDQVMLHLKINRIQVDNQLHDCIFPVVLAPTPPPKTVANANQAPKPFVELSLLKRKDKRVVDQYKYFKILVQEFHVKIDIGFLQQIWLFLAAEELTNEQLKQSFKNDLDFTEKPLISHVEIVSSTELKNFYDLLHFSPLKVHFSFSLAGNIDSGSLPPSFSVMLQSLGVTLTDVHDVIFRLSYFERKSAFLTNPQLINEVISHYYGQAVRQAYVLLLGLDVIGNPYGLIVGIKEGVEAFFYEPVQGIIQGPSDFATGVAIGCRSLFGHTVGSTAGTLGKLTETLGKGLAVLSLDKEYQIQRMEGQHRSENIQASMARGGRGLVMGVIEGVTGVVKKPIEGAKEEGVGGFFKGVGKGMMGLVTRPVTGVVDFASSSLNAVKRVAEPSVDNKRLRPPRFFRSDTLVEPYNLHDAKGNAILYAICKRKYCVNDKYEFYAELKDKEVVILTNKRFLLAELSELFGTWQEHVAVTWSSMPDRPHSHTKGVALTLPPRGGIAKREKPDVKVLLIDDKELKQEMYLKMVELYNLEAESES